MGRPYVSSVTVVVWRLLIVVAVAAATNRVAVAQTVHANHVSLVTRGEDLDDVLDRLSRMSGATIAYESAITRGHHVYCIVEDVSLEDALRCALRDTGLDFFRLSSGAYVIATAARSSTILGYLRGVVVDEQTGNALADANVVLDGSIGVATNRSGRFILPPLLPGTYGLRVSHVSYDTWQGTITIQPGQAAGTNIRMAPRTVIVRPVVVDGTVSDSGFERESISSRQQNRRKLDASGGPFRALDDIAGVRISDVTADVRIQGSQSGELFFLLDGVPLFLPRSSIGIVGPFGAFAIDRFIVHRTGFGVRPGSYTSGVIEAEHAVGSPAGSEVQLDPTGVNARIDIGRNESATQAMIAGRVGLWQVFAPRRFEDVLSLWSAADPFLLVAPSRRYEYATPSFISDSLGLRVATQPTVQYGDLHTAIRHRISLLRTLDVSMYVGSNGFVGDRTATDARFQSDENSELAALSIGDDYRWTTSAGRLRYSTFVGNRTLAQFQVGTSHYRLRHNYKLIEQLALPAAFDQMSPSEAKSGEAQAVHDRNSVDFTSLGFTVDHARLKHQVAGGLEMNLLRNSIALQSSSTADSSPESAAAPELLNLESRQIALSEQSFQVNAFIEDDWTPVRPLQVTSGLRATYLPAQQRVYAEPRIEAVIRIHTALGELSTRSAAGLYRQFVLQTDVSNFNAGSLLPNVRMWLPVDGSIRPPASYHVSQLVAIRPAPSLRLSAEAFARYQRHGLAVNYGASQLFTTTNANRQFGDSDLLTGTTGKTEGITIKMAYESGILSVDAGLTRMRSERTASSLFNGRTTTVPGVEPRVFNFQVALRPRSNLVLRAAWRSAAGAAFGFTPAYYDYFGQDTTSSVHGPFDFSNPDQHVLPANQSLDLGAAVSRQVGRLGLQVRAEVLNALDRANTSEWKLLFVDGELVKAPRPVYPRLTTLAIRLTW